MAMTVGDTRSKLHEIHDVLTNKDCWLPVKMRQIIRIRTVYIRGNWVG